MRVPTSVVGLCLAAQIGATVLAQTAPDTPPPAGDAQAVMAAAREALGGDKRIAAVKTLVATGRTRQVQGDNLVPIEFEIDIELPDKYARTDEIPARESGATTRGFNGSQLIQAPAPGGGRPMPANGAPREGGPAPGGRGGVPSDATAPLKQDFARLTLGMFASSFGPYPLAFRYAGAAEAPEGKADVVEVTGAGGFSARLFINSQTHMPLMLSWTAMPGIMAAPPAQTPPPKPPENRLLCRLSRC
jgi:hypothetical protein